jgi:SAM-dependent methyltransferase
MDVKLRYLGSVLPLIIGSPDLFQPLRAFLTDSHYSEAKVCDRLGLKRAEDYLTLNPNPAAPHPVRDALDLLSRLFLIGEFVKEKQIEKYVPAPAFECLKALGLIARAPAQADGWYATAALYPAYGLYIVSDRWSSPEAAPIRLATDVVYPAITVNSRDFMESLPTDHCERFLDLCSGSGNAALRAASDYAGHAWSLDVAESSAHCAEFNRLLNGTANATVGRGDLFEPVRGQTFDRIVANPPYMPSIRPAELYAYGGELGDKITRRIVEELPAYLQPGGRFYCVTAGPDRKTEGFESRIRSWLASSGPQFDVFLVERRQLSTDTIAHQQATRTRGGIDEVDEWKKVFEKYEVENIVYGTVLIQRHTGPSKPVTVRRSKGRQLGTAEIEWLRSWETAAAEGGIFQRILDSRPIVAPSLTLQVTHRLQGGELAPQDFRLETNYPFTVECSIQPWAAYVLPRCDGKTTAREHLAWLKENELVAANEPEEELADYLRVLISGGFIEIDGFRLPPH